MKPVEVKISGHTQKSSREICEAILDTTRWSEFKGYAILPGIKNAQFEVQTPSVVGSRIKVHNSDGSSHVEEIIEWDVMHKIALKFQEFSPPVQNVATHFIETLEFHPTPNGTDVSRVMRMYPKNLLGWLLLIPISQLMKKAYEENLRQMSITTGDAPN